MRTLKNSEELAMLLAAEKLLVVQFGAHSCAPCSAIRQKIEAWAARGNVAAVYIPVETFPELAAQAGVFAVPCVFVYVEGRLTVRESGYFSVEEILAKVERYQEMLS